MLDKKQKLVLTIIIFIFLVLDFITVWYYTKDSTFSKTFTVFMTTLLIFGAIALIVGVAFWLFKKQKIDTLYLMKKGLVGTCKNSAPDLETPIYMFNGKNSRKIGYYKGYTMIKSSDWIDCLEVQDREYLAKFLKDNGIKKEIKKVEQTYIYIIAFLPIKSHETELIIVSEKDINGLESNPIVLYDHGFAPKLYEFHILAKYYDVGNYIEMPIKTLINKYTLEHNLREQVNIIDNAIDLDGRHIKAQEKSNIEDFAVNQK